MAAGLIGWHGKSERQRTAPARTLQLIQSLVRRHLMGLWIFEWHVFF
jgi:hypothetical protein